MGKSLAEEIAVLDGLDGFGETDGRIGQKPASVTQYARQILPNVLARTNVLDASAGANYSGGSSYAPGLPLMPSSVGLADADLINYSKVANMLPARTNVIDASVGANYSGGSSYAPGLPLLPSSAGLAASIIDGGYGRAGLGRLAASIFGGGYGNAGLGRADMFTDFSGVNLADIDQKFGSTLEIEDDSIMDGRIGQTPADGDEYSQATDMFGVRIKQNVLDASAGANYSGGSSYAPGLPLLPSNAGLAELSMSEDLDGLSDAALGRMLGSMGLSASPMLRAASKSRVQSAKSQASDIQAKWSSMTPEQKYVARNKLKALGVRLGLMRGLRRAATMAMKSPIARKRLAGAIQKMAA